MRVVSLLPSATEIVCAIGAGSELMGRSHECDFPPGVETVPALTRARIGGLPSSKAIDSAVRDVLKDALAIYAIDVEKLGEIQPDVVVTQDLCDVCAVSLDDVQAAVARLARKDVRIVSLHPTTLEGIWNDVRSVGGALGRREAAEALVSELRARVAQVHERAAEVPGKPSVLTIEWTDPVMLGGMWMPELVALAGGVPLVTKPADHAPTMSKEELAALDPDVVLVKPCGFDLERTLAETEVLRETLPWKQWRAVAQGRVYAADGNAFFNRPGPRIVESLEILAACIHPETFADLGRKHEGSFSRLKG